jgi:hypothetical protein
MLLGSTEPVTMPCNLLWMLKKHLPSLFHIILVVPTDIVCLII